MKTVKAMWKLYTDIHNYKLADCGAVGKAFESAFTHKAVKKQGKIDYYHNGEKYEVKVCGGKLIGIIDTKAHKKVIYAPLPMIDKNGMVDIYTTEGFIFDSCEQFMQAVNEAHMLTYRSGIPYIQTFWNAKKNAPHSKKAIERWYDALYNNCSMTLEEFLQGD